MTSLYKSKELQLILQQELGGNKARITLLSYLIISVLKVRSVNFKRLATGYDNGVLLSSKLRRVQRFFSQFTFAEALYCKLIMKTLPIEGKYELSLDRTNWKLGQLNINILFLSVIYKGVGLPVFWCTLGNKRGNSSQKERKDLLNRFMLNFGDDKIAYLTADREFVGQDWLAYLTSHQIRYFIRVRNNMHITLAEGKTVKAYWLLMAQRLNRVYFHPKIVYLNDTLGYFSGIKYVGQNGKIDYLILVSYNQEDLSLDIYKNRWQIETMFRAFKSAGFNLEDTHITDYERLDTLIKVISIAFVWSYSVGIYLNDCVKKIAIKNHGRRAVSFFTYGLDFLTNAFINTIRNDIKIAFKIFLSCT
ncbi:IS4 family transposase [Flammeovirgaceae bacterium SG7u.111]|nr:IS4 family transposase [Flammeovirgaceae bacterium SG7u.132]WPO34503.1 IS4 family transposase [Flammeovirgaceae bacterium SG7u.111]MDW7694790.1 IS4 family transposase [Flammeovirgaceae bacterium SG7u.132]WPO34571.1 IS4 family transposase [Flammeovirgaceae bacterium SG7u.111]WPO37191.1 IS4 family transposase [Flammeovirgaceae bacterium SG7u.111]